MSNIAAQCESGYTGIAGGAITVADVLQQLRADLEAQLATLADATRAVQHLRVAIAAIERDESETKKQIEHQRPTCRRGYLSRAVIDAMREGVGTVALLVKHLKRQGINTTGPSVSNVIQRLQEKKLVHFDSRKQKWVLSADRSQPAMASFEEGEANKVSAPDVPSGAVKMAGRAR